MQGHSKGTTRIAVSEIPIGAVCQADIFDETDRLLLGKGVVISQEICEQLMERGTTYLDVPLGMFGTHQLGAGEVPTRAPAKGRTESLAERDQRISELERVDRRGQDYCAERGERIAKQMKQSIEKISQMGASIDALTRNDLREMNEVPKGLLGLLLDDADQTVSQCLSPQATDRLATRCVRMSMMSINVAVELGMPFDEVLRIGSAALLHDFGLFLSPSKFHDPRSPLDDEERWQYQQHPLVIRDLLSRSTAIDQETIVITAHVHERGDGSGYPRGLKQNLIHSGTRVIHVIDTYLALTEYYGDYPCMAPHDAMKFLLYETNRGQLSEDAVRAFLNQNSLFPVGSRVRLTDGSEAMVARRNQDDYLHPSVQCAETDRLRNLSQEKVSITAGVVLPKTQVRFTSDSLKCFSLSKLLRMEPALVSV